MVEQILILLFIGLWLIQLKRNKDLKEQDWFYILLLVHLLEQAYEFVPDEQEELLSQIEEVLYDKEDIEQD